MKHHCVLKAVLPFTAFALLCGPAVAQEPSKKADAAPAAGAKAPAGKPGEMKGRMVEEEELPVTVASVSGPAQRLVVDKDGKQTWQPLKAGEKLSGETVIRTGFRAKVVLKFADRSDVTINSATKFGVKKFVKSGSRKVTARLGLKYGTIDAQVHKAAGENDVQVATPVATLAVGGSGAGVGFGGDSGMGVKGKSGNWKGSTPGGGQINVGGGENTQTQGGGFIPSGQFGLMKRNVGIGGGFGGLTKLERLNIMWYGDGRGITGFLTGIGSNAPRGGAGQKRIPFGDRLNRDGNDNGNGGNGNNGDEYFDITPGPEDY